MNNRSNKHEYYELLNLLGHGLAKFNHDSIKQFRFKAKEHFYQYFVDLNIIKTKSVVKSRQDLFNPYFDNRRLGWR